MLISCMRRKPLSSRVEQHQREGPSAKRLFRAEAHLATAELEALQALLVPLGAHATGAGDGAHVGGCVCFFERDAHRRLFSVMSG